MDILKIRSSSYKNTKKLCERQNLKLKVSVFRTILVISQI
nr:MAG TPA: hypothetical protein [Caudoviricetes sp.]